MTEETAATTASVDEEVQHPFAKGLELYEQKGDYSEIITLFEQGVTLSPKDSVGYTCLAWLHMLRNSDDDASKGLLMAQKAVRLDPSNYQAHVNLVLAMLMNGTSGVRPEFQRAMGEVTTEEDQAEVLENLNDAIAREPEWDAPRKMLAWIQG